jgi:filamentous hemagglutinin family protein
MSPKRRQQHSSRFARVPAWVGAVAAMFFAPGRAAANPEGMTVAAGQVSAVASGNQLNLTASHNAVINWASFNIGAGETTTFLQPGAASVVWNRIADVNPSQIWGNLNANGIVVLMNQSGFYFGPNSSINVGGFIATTAPVNPPLPAGAPVWAQPATPPLASIINYGSINVASCPRPTARWAFTRARRC